MGLIEDAKVLITGMNRLIPHPAYDAWLARYDKRGKVKVRVFQDPPTFWQWDCEECRVRSYALMSSRDAAIADAKMVAELLEIEIEIEGEADAH